MRIGPLRGGRVESSVRSSQTRMSEPVKRSIKGQRWSNDSSQGSTMDRATTSDKQGASSATTTDSESTNADHPTDGRFNFTAIHHYLSDSTYPAGFTKELRINVHLEKERSTSPAVGESCITSAVSRVSAQSINQHVKRPNYLQYSNNC